MKTIEKKLLGVLFLAFAAGCGGGAAATGEEKLDPNTDISPVPSVQKRLVLDLSDAELLYRASNLGDSYLKRNQEDADGETTESPATETSTSATELVAVLLQKVTTDFKVKPALYLEREFKLNTLKNQETDADSATETSADIIPDDVVPPLGNVYTTATDTFIFFSYAFSYNSGNSCSLFRIKSRTALECADSVAVDVDNLKIDRAGNLYYEAVLEDKTVLRKRSAADGTLTDLATLDEATDNGFYDWEVMPSGMILARTDPRDVTEGALAVFKRISSAGEATISVPEEYDECGVQDDQRVLSTNGNLIFAGCHETADGGEESGIFSLSFDVGSVPTLLLSDNNEDSLIESLMGCSFRIDNEDHLWCSALLKGEGYNFTRLIRITPEP
ncbi:MAG: hypothetical protein Q7S00_01830, partial [bacterium]|nr:hypothetical protein [bacterium]